jgi:hypothetical protein
VTFKTRDLDTMLSSSQAGSRWLSFRPCWRTSSCPWRSAHGAITGVDGDALEFTLCGDDHIGDLSDVVVSFIVDVHTRQFRCAPVASSAIGAAACEGACAPVSANEPSKCFQGGLHTGSLENSNPDLVPELRLEHRKVGIIQVVAFLPECRLRH